MLDFTAGWCQQPAVPLQPSRAFPQQPGVALRRGSRQGPLFQLPGDLVPRRLPRPIHRLQAGGPRAPRPKTGEFHLSESCPYFMTLIRFILTWQVRKQTPKKKQATRNWQLWSRQWGQSALPKGLSPQQGFEQGACCVSSSPYSPGSDSYIYQRTRAQGYDKSAYSLLKSYISSIHVNINNMNHNEWFIMDYLLTYCPLCLLACRAATKALHSRLSWAILWIDPQVWWRLVISFSTVRRQEFLGRPRFLLPSGVQWRAVLVMSSAFFLKICPIHLHLLLISISSILSWWHVSYNSSLDTVLGQNIRSMHLKLLVWNPDSFWRSFFLWIFFFMDYFFFYGFFFGLWIMVPLFTLVTVYHLVNSGHLTL